MPHSYTWKQNSALKAKPSFHSPAALTLKCLFSWCLVQIIQLRAMCFIDKTVFQLQSAIYLCIHTKRKQKQREGALDLYSWVSPWQTLALTIYTVSVFIWSLLFKAGEGLLFWPSVPPLDVSWKKSLGIQSDIKIRLYSFRKFWLRSPYITALRQLLK